MRLGILGTSNLALLRFTVPVTTIATGLAILFIGRYRRSWFCLDVGVLRWSWRVGFYGYSALGTDSSPGKHRLSRRL
ncbi:hypothetical protein DQ353_12250 [Arthrobacter sp. AQ5-05]|nr:hypothetical protein DQ353_12250 [Arthrobacter sp. AQ5-05]